MTEGNSTMDDISSSLQDLKLLSENSKNLVLQLDSLIKALSDSDEKAEFCEKVVDDSLLGSLTNILQTGNIKDKAKAAEFIAELAKVEQCRLSCVFNGVVPLIVELLQSDDLDANLQACRSLGNVCYEHVNFADGGRVCVTGNGALKKLVSLMYRLLKLPKTPQTHQLKLISTGFLLNILNSYEIVKKYPEHIDIMEVLGVYLNECIDEDDILIHIMLSVSCIVDEDFEQCEIIVNNFTPSFIRVLNLSSSIEVHESCLELLSAIAENDCFKPKMVEHGTAEAVINVVRKFRSKYDEEMSQSVIKVAADLVVLILVGDECMTALYDNGKGIVYKELLDWVSSDVLSLKIAGSLAVGNFARTDENCIQMVGQGISSMLLGVLSRNSTNEDDMRIQHALLSALGNLAISRINKPLLIKQGCLNVILPMVEVIESYPVVFKLLGTLRMLVDGQPETAARIGGSRALLEKLVGWANISDPPGVQAEAGRILAWLVHSIDDKKSLLDIYKASGALVPLVNMIVSEHQIMQLEASFSLKHLCVNVDKEVADILKNAKFPEKCTLLIRNADPHVLCSMFSILQAISQSEYGLLLLRSGELIVSLEEWFANSYDSTVCPDRNFLNVIKG